MTSRRTVLKGLLASAALGAVPFARAHRFHAGIADISHNAQTGSLEIVHTYMAHDFEALLMNVYQRAFDMADPDDQAAVRKYIDKQFWLADKAGKRIPLNWVGVTVDTDSLTVYQEAPGTPADKVETIHNAVLVDFLPDQVNTVNFTAGGSLRTFGFSAGRTEISVH
jgi:hypothetical protein